MLTLDEILQLSQIRESKLQKDLRTVLSTRKKWQVSIHFRLLSLKCDHMALKNGLSAEYDFLNLLLWSHNAPRKPQLCYIHRMHHYSPVIIIFFMDIKVIFILRLYFSIDQEGAKIPICSSRQEKFTCQFFPSGTGLFWPVCLPNMSSFCLHIAVKQLKINQVLLVSRKSLWLGIV